MHERKSGSDAHAAFRYPNFRRYMSARFLTTVSSEMQSVAVGWQVYELTHRPLDLGLVGLAQFLPGILLFLLAGHAADRIPRNRILQTCYAAFSLCSLMLLGFTLHGPRSPYPLYVILLLNGAVRAFNGPASQAFLPVLVPPSTFKMPWPGLRRSCRRPLWRVPCSVAFVYGLGASPVPVYCCSAAAYLTAFVLMWRVQSAG